MDVDDELPPHVKYWLTTTSKNDCFFVLGSESGLIQRIGAFKIILFAFSEPLQNMLANSQLAEKGDIRIVDVEPGTFWTFLKCVYGGSEIVMPKLSFQESVNLLYVLEKYLVTEIKPKVVSHILQALSMTFDNIFCAISNPVCFQIEELEKAIMKIVYCNGNTMLDSKKLLLLSSEALLQIVKVAYLNTSESNVWNGVVKWAKHTTQSSDGEILRKQILPHLKFVRICTFSCEEFCKNVVPTGILTNEEVVEVCKYFSSGNAPKLEQVCNSTVSRFMTKTATQNTLYHIVNNIEDLREQKSSAVMFHNYSWNILLKKTEKSLSLYLQCGGNSKDSSWKIPIVADLVLLNQEDKPNLCRHVEKTLCTTENDWGYCYFCSWSQLMDVSNGFVKHGTIIVMVQMKVDSK
uniref:MATH domain-containing protein n=1 Tax=Graphocephala atropunctata TaxID=36148 RepID=A0A1B6LK00_9HEMI